MNQESDGDELREGFRELRADTERAGGVPDFQPMIARAKLEASRPTPEVGAGSVGRRRSQIAVWASLASAAAIAALVLLNPPAPDGDAEFESLVSAFASNSASGVWRSPTSAFLEVPGLYLATVPSIGASVLGVDLERAPDRLGSEGRDS